VLGLVPKATVNLRIYAGGLNEAGRNGLSGMTAQMLREGAAGKKGSDLAEEAAAMGGSINLGNGLHETTLGIAALSERTTDAIRLLGDVALHPDFPAGELERIRQNTLRSLSVARSQPQTAANAALAAAYYGADSPYGRILPTDEQVKSYTLEDIKAFYRANFGAKRARLYVAGQFDPVAVKATIEQVFGGWAAGPERLRVVPTVQPGPRVILVDRPGASQSTLRLAWPSPVAGSPGDVPFEVMDALLGGSFTSRITKNIREDKGYTYSPFSSVDFNPGEGSWTFNADVTSDVTGAALKEVFGEIRRLQTVPVPDSEATGIRTWMSGTYILQNASQGGLIGSLAQIDLLGRADRDGTQRLIRRVHLPEHAPVPLESAADCVKDAGRTILQARFDQDNPHRIPDDQVALGALGDFAAAPLPLVPAFALLVNLRAQG